MNIDKCGFSVFDSDDLVQMMYQGKLDKIFDVFVLNDKETNTFNYHLSDKESRNLNLYTDTDLTASEILFVHQQLQQEWFMPDSYKNIDLGEYLLSKCTTEDQKTRVVNELAEFNQRNMLMLLRYMIYLVDFMKEKNIVWGVGRGSSVASYILYLIGVHRVDSLKYDLDFKEFMR